MAEYLQITKELENDLSIIDKIISECLCGETSLDSYLKEFILNGAKKIRPILAILFYKSVYQKELTQKQYMSLAVIELIHSATLIHDDIIDNAQLRRGNASINFKFNNNLAVIAGDYLLAVAMHKILDLQSQELIKRYTECLKNLCCGEINQYFNKFEMPAIETYLSKTKNKTATLFSLAVVSPIIAVNETDTENIILGENFGENFGIGFQIKNDLKNFCSISDNEFSSDIDNGIYTAPVILSAIKSLKDLSKVEIFEQVKKSEGLAKTKQLIDTYTSRTLILLQDLKESKQKNLLEKTVSLLKEENEF